MCPAPARVEAAARVVDGELAAAHELAVPDPDNDRDSECDSECD